MKEFKRVISFVLVLVLATASFAFAVTPAAVKTTTQNAVKATDAAIKAEPTVEIVSPEQNSIVCSDSFLVSVKLNKAETIKVSVFEEKAAEKKVVTTYVSGVAVTKEAISYSSFDTTSFEAINLTSNAALVTAKDFLYTTPATFTNAKDSIAFYTTRIENVTPGIYKVLVEVVEEVKTKDAKTGKETKTEKTVEQVSSIICVKEKAAETEPTTTLTVVKEKASAITVITNFFKSLFK